MPITQITDGQPRVVTAKCSLPGTCPVDSCTGSAGHCLGYVSGVVPSVRAAEQYGANQCPEFSPSPVTVVAYEPKAIFRVWLSLMPAHQQLRDVGPAATSLQS